MITVPGTAPVTAAVLLAAAFLIVASTAHAQRLAVDDRILNAIRLVENVKDPRRSGPAGELGYFRITPAVWAEHTKADFARCGTSETLERAVARLHLAWLRMKLSRRLGTKFTDNKVYYLALAWNGGLSGAVSGSAPAEAKDYAERVVNIYTNATQWE